MTDAAYEAALSEDVELPMERRRVILDAFARLEGMTHYESLGLSRQASRQEIRAAYFEQSKVFHPDTLFRKRLGSFKPKMEAIFTRITEAYEVLGRKRSRAEYDQYLALCEGVDAVEKTIDEAAETAEAIAEDLVQGSDATSAAEAPAVERPPRPPAPAITDHARVQARRSMAKRLARAAGRNLQRSKPGPAPSQQHSVPAPSGAPMGRARLLRSLTGSLKQAAAITGGPNRVRAYLEQAQLAEQQGEVVAAANALRLAVALEPTRTDLVDEHQRLKALASRELAESYEKQARYEQKHEKWNAAALSWSRVVDGRPEDAKAACSAAQALLKTDGDLKSARRYAQAAVDLEPKEAAYRVLLGEVFLRAGMKLNARRELETANTLDPGDEMVENLLSQAGE